MRQLPTARSLVSPRSLKIPALALITLLGAGVIGSGTQQADGSEAPVEPAVGPATAGDRAASTAASRSDGRQPLATGSTSAPKQGAAAQGASTDGVTHEHGLPTVVPAGAAKPSTEPDASPDPEAARETLPEVTGQLWTTDAVNVRTKPSADAAKVTTVSFATAVEVTGEAEAGYSQVVFEGAVAWISSDFLSESEPEAQEQASGAAGVSGAACSVNPEIESSLQGNATAAYRAVCAAFPQVTAYGGIRPGDSGDHGTGRAVDIMISGDTGWEIARYLQANAGALGVTYVIYQQQMWMAGEPTSSWRAMEDRGGTTANHFDHVHVSTS
ncbi:SH3 domain-containing protein [Cellulosimicrobium terreum]|nr:SH3 domain-containing protein [Cellulosimicrobium terreum]